MIFTARDWTRRLGWFQLIAYSGIAISQFVSCGLVGAFIGGSDGQIVVEVAVLAAEALAILWLVARVFRDARRRARAVVADLRLMPLARAAAPVAPAPSPVQLPLEMLWSPRQDRVLSGCVLAFVVLIAVAFLAGAGVLLVGPLLIPSQLGPAAIGSTPAANIALGALLIIFAVPFLILVWLGSRITFEPPKRIGVVADVDGLHEYRLGRSERVVRWEDARLLEVVTTIAAGSQRLTVFSKRGRVSWMVPPLRLDAETIARVQMQHNALLALLKERAGLEPRTLERSLLPAEGSVPTTLMPTSSQSSKPSRGRERLARLLLLGIFLPFLVFYGVLLGAVAYVCIAVPLTGVPAVDDYAAAATLLPFVVLAAPRAWGLLLAPVRRSREPVLPYLPLAPTATSYELRWQLGTVRRQVSVVIGAVCLPAIIPAVWGFVRYIQNTFSPVGTGPEVAHAVLLPLACAGPAVGFGIGIFLVWRGLKGEPRTIHADASGLVVGQWRSNPATVIPWQEVTALTLVRALRGETYFRVETAKGERSISWPATARTLPAPPSATGKQPISSEELAALVAARSGVALRIAGDVQ